MCSRLVEGYGGQVVNHNIAVLIVGSGVGADPNADNAATIPH